MSARRETVFLFFTFYLVYAVTSPGDLMGDSEVRWLIAERLADTGWFDLAPGTCERAVEGTHGRQYFFTGPVQPICLVPFVVLGHLVAAVPLGLQVGADALGQLAASIVLFPVCGALAVMVLYAIALDATGDRRAALQASVLYGLATMHWHNSVNTYEESQVAVFALGALWASQRAWQRGGWTYPVLACIAMGLAAAVRVTSVTLTAPIGLVALWSDAASRPGTAARARRVGVWAVAGAVGVLPFIIALMAFNHARFGSPWEAGYGRHVAEVFGMGLFDTPLWQGLGGLLISPGKGVFLFNPILILAVPGAAMLWRSHRQLCVIATAAFAGTVLFHARYTFWSGDLAWGPRYLASGMGIYMLLLIPLLQSAGRRRLVLSLAAISLCVQAASVAYSFGLEFAQDRRHGVIPDGYVWRPAESQLFARFRNIGLHLAGRPDYRSTPPLRERPEMYQVTTPPEVVRRLHAVHFFPFKAFAFTGKRSLFHALLVPWLAMLAALGVLVWRWHRQARRGCGHSDPGIPETTGPQPACHS